MQRFFGAILGGLCVLLGGLLFTWADFRALHLGDQDYTNISRAIAHSQLGKGLDGILPAPHVSSGSTGSFLGHHFAPALLFLRIVYALPGASHLVYGIILALALALGVSLLLWEARSLPRQAFLIFWPGVVFSPALWQLQRSYHFESLAFPLTILTFVLARRNAKMHWLCISLLFWLMIKEDMVFGVFLMGMYLVVDRKRSGPLLIVSGLLWSLLAAGVLAYLNEDSIRLHYFRSASGPTKIMGWSWILWPFFLIFFSRWWPLFLPGFLLLSLSSHPWLSTLEGHYVYILLPLLFLAQLEGLTRITAFAAWKAGLIVFLCLLGNVLTWQKKSHLYALPAEHPDRRLLLDLIDKEIQLLPRGTCIQAAIPYSAHVPLDYPVFPLIAPHPSPYRENQPPYIRLFHEHECEDMYLLFDSRDPRPPYYTEEHLDALKNHYAARDRLVDLSGKRVAAGPDKKTM